MDKDFFLVIIGKEYHIVEATDVYDIYILQQLYRKYHFAEIFFRLIGIFDENTNSVLIFKGLKVINVSNSTLKII